MLKVEWAEGGHVSRFDARFLSALRGNPDVLPVAHTTWDRDAMGARVPQVPHAEFMRDEAAVKEFLELTARFGFCFVEGVPGTPEATKAVAARLAYTRETIFGGYWDFTANLEHKDTAYTSMAIGPHTDGTYSLDAPGLPDVPLPRGRLHRRRERADRRLSHRRGHAWRDSPEDYRLLTEVAIPGQYLDEGRGIHLMARRPLFHGSMNRAR